MAAKKKAVGKRTDFSPEEQALLREYAKRVMRERDLTGTELGLLIGIEQQNVSRFLNERGGIGRTTANALVKLGDFGNSDEFLHEAKISAGADVDDPKGRWAKKKAAARLALQAGFDPEVVERVMSAHESPEDARASKKWWLTQIALAELGMSAGRRGPT